MMEGARRYVPSARGTTLALEIVRETRTPRRAGDEAVDGGGDVRRRTSC